MLTKKEICRFHTISNGLEINFHNLNRSFHATKQRIASKFGFECVSIFGKIATCSYQVADAHLLFQRVNTRRANVT